VSDLVLTCFKNVKRCDGDDDQDKLVNCASMKHWARFWREFTAKSATQDAEAKSTTNLAPSLTDGLTGQTC
jgi:hypothetical protein